MSVFHKVAGVPREKMEHPSVTFFCLSAGSVAGDPAMHVVVEWSTPAISS